MTWPSTNQFDFSLLFSNEFSKIMTVEMLINGLPSETQWRFTIPWTSKKQIDLDWLSVKCMDWRFASGSYVKKTAIHHMLYPFQQVWVIFNKTHNVSISIKRKVLIVGTLKEINVRKRVTDEDIHCFVL